MRELSAANRSLALGVTASDRTQQADLGIAGLPTAERADLLATKSVYNETGVSWRSSDRCGASTSPPT
ncbi:hypothetical protein SGLAM104S_05353 [Streptomyces glaucescens]